MPFIFPLCRLCILAPPVPVPVRRAPVLHVEGKGGKVVADQLHKLLETDLIVAVGVALLQYICVVGWLHIGILGFTYWVCWDMIWGYDVGCGHMGHRGYDVGCGFGDWID